MNVPNITQGPGSVRALPRPASDGAITPSGTAAVVPAPARVHAPEPTISLTRLACFDINGDGHIDPRSAGTGGDATLLVPTHEVDLPTWSHAVNPMQSPRPVRGKDAGSGEQTDDRTAGNAAKANASQANAAQTNRAVGAYQRYGQTPSASPPEGATIPTPSGDTHVAGTHAVTTPAIDVTPAQPAPPAVTPPTAPTPTPPPNPAVAAA